jgi:hypothetical protein
VKRKEGPRELTHYVADEGEIVRFMYESGDYFEVRMDGGVLCVRVSGGQADMLTVTPEVANTVHIYPLRWNGKRARHELLPVVKKGVSPAQAGPEKGRV